jgi:hypothetical protein
VLGDIGVKMRKYVRIDANANRVQIKLRDSR